MRISPRHTGIQFFWSIDIPDKNREKSVVILQYTGTLPCYDGIPSDGIPLETLHNKKKNTEKE